MKHILTVISFCRGDSTHNKKVKAKLTEEIMLAEKENGFEASDVNSKFFFCLSLSAI